MRKLRSSYHRAEQQGYHRGARTVENIVGKKGACLEAGSVVDDDPSGRPVGLWQLSGVTITGHRRADRGVRKIITIMISAPLNNILAMAEECTRLSLLVNKSAQLFALVLWRIMPPDHTISGLRAPESSYLREAVTPTPDITRGQENSHSRLS